MSFHPPVPFALREEGRSDEFLKELHDKLSAKHLKSVIKMRGMMLFKKNSFKRLNLRSRGSRTASWLAAAGTTEFLNHLFKNVL
jgi:hypothetical protein